MAGLGSHDRESSKKTNGSKKASEGPLPNAQGEWLPLNGYYYQQVAPLGTGAFANVYRGLRPLGGGGSGRNKSWENIAVKHMPINGSGTNRLNRIWEEIRLMRQLRHPHILRLYDVYLALEEEAVYLFLEYCDGGNLQPYTHRDLLTKQQVESVARQIRDGLQYLYQQSILHRDLKPQNLLLQEGGTSGGDLIVKIADFGLSTLMEGELLTTVCGSPLYMAPEILEGQPYTNKGDLWSLGVILYQLVYHRHPYPSQTREELNLKIRQKVAFPATERLNEAGLALLKQLLVRDPALRISWGEAGGFLNHTWFRNMTVRPKEESRGLSFQGKRAEGDTDRSRGLSFQGKRAEGDQEEPLSLGRGNVQLSFLGGPRPPPQETYYKEVGNEPDDDVFTLSLHSVPTSSTPLTDSSEDTYFSADDEENRAGNTSDEESPGPRSSVEGDSEESRRLSSLRELAEGDQEKSRGLRFPGDHAEGDRVEESTSEISSSPQPSLPVSPRNGDGTDSQSSYPPLPSVPGTPNSGLVMERSLRKMVVDDYQPTPIGGSLTYSAVSGSSSIRGRAIPPGQGSGASSSRGSSIAASAPIAISVRNYGSSSSGNASTHSSAHASASSWLGKTGKGLKSWWKKN